MDARHYVDNEQSTFILDWVALLVSFIDTLQKVAEEQLVLKFITFSATIVQFWDYEQSMEILF